MNLPINHLIKTLDRCCGQWEILNHDEARQKSDSRCWGVVVKHLNTGEIYRCNFRPSTGKWESDDDSFLVNRLNGLTRDDDGDPLPVVLGKSVDELCKEAFDFDCVPEPSEAPFKAGDWVVCVDANEQSLHQAPVTSGGVYQIEATELGWIKAAGAWKLAERFRRARPDEIPQTVNQIPCGGCGAKTSKERCIGCFHNFGDEPQPATPRTPADAPPTLQQSNAEICRQNGWTVGTVLEGDEGLGPEQIEITAIGKDCVLACRETDEYESLWSLKYRQWKVVSPPALQLREGAWYRTEQGEVFGPMAYYDKSCNQWYVEANGGLLWKGNGKEILPSLWKPPADLIREVAPPQPEPQPDSEGWIEHDGSSSSPVQGDTLVDIVNSLNGRVFKSYRAIRTAWQYVSRYRIVTPRNIRVKPNEPVVVNMSNEEVTPAPSPQYRPFASESEFLPNRERWVIRKQGHACRIVGHADCGVIIGTSSRVWTWREFFDEYEFEDGSPCGVEVK